MIQTTLSNHSNRHLVIWWTENLNMNSWNLRYTYILQKHTTICAEQKFKLKWNQNKSFFYYVVTSLAVISNDGSVLSLQIYSDTFHRIANSNCDVHNGHVLFIELFDEKKNDLIHFWFKFGLYEKPYIYL